MARKNKASKGAGGSNFVSNLKGFAAEAKSSVLDFEELPLVHASFLATTLGLAVSIPSFIVCMALAINNISIAGKIGLSGAPSGFRFLSAGQLYYGSISSVVFILLFVAAIALLVVYKVKHPMRKGGVSVKWLGKYWAFSVLIMMVALPLVLMFAENIMIIIAVVVGAVVLFFVLSSIGDDSESASSPKSAASKESKSKADSKISGSDVPIKKVPAALPVFRGETVWSGKGMFFYGYDKEVHYICSQSDYDKGKVRIVEERHQDRDHVVGPIPAGAKPMMSDWES